MAVQVNGIALVIGSRDFHVKGLQVMLAGPTPNNTLPLVDPASGGGVSSTSPFQSRAFSGQKK